MNTKGIRHIGIFTENPDSMIEFYRDILNFKIVYNETETFCKMLNLNQPVNVNVVKMASENGSQIEILSLYRKLLSGEYKEYFDKGITHIALSVTDLDNIYNKLKENNYICVTNEPYRASEKVKVLFCKDCDGNILELVEDL